MSFQNPSLEKENKFRFVCPSINKVVKYYQCSRGHELRVLGRAPVQTPACNACQKSGKCPLPHMQTEEFKLGKPIYCDLTGEKKPGKVSDQIALRMKPIMIQKYWIEYYGIEGAEAKALLENHAPVSSSQVAAAKPAKAARSAPKKAELDIQQVDQAALVNKMIEKEAA